MAFNKNNKKIVTTALTAAMVASAVAPVAAATKTVTPAQAATKAVDAYYKLSVKTRADVSNSAKVKVAAQKAIAKLTSKKDAKLKASLTKKVTTKSAAINKYYKTVIVVAETEAKNIATAKAALEAAKAYVVTADTKVEDVEKMFADGMVLVNKIKTASVKADLIKQATDLKAEVLKKIEELAVPKVASITAINATQVEVKFNKAVDPASVFTNGTSGAFKATVTFTTIDGVVSGALTGTLSSDGKTLTVTSANPLSKRYDVVVDGVVAKDGKTATKYNDVVTFASDTVAPAILSTVKNSAGSFTVNFSEPIKSLGAVSYKLADGTVVVAGGTGISNDFVAGAKSVTFTVGSDVAAGKEVIATFIGAQDQAGNLLTPNPATASFVKGAKDGAVPTVSSITQTGAKTFAVKFSEELISNPVVTINGTAAASIVKDSTDPTKYNVTTTAVLDGAATIAVSSITDLSGEVGTDLTRVVTFVKETAAPKVVSSAVVADANNNKQYLEVTFDKDVLLGATPTVAGAGSFVKDFVTNTAAFAATPVAYKDANNKKVVRVELATLLGGVGTDVEGAAYTLDLTFAGVASAAAVDAEGTKVTFTRGKDGVPANVDVLNVNSVARGTDNNKVVVTFDRAVDGATATNVANYKIDGAIVESVTLNPAAVGGTQVAVLNLKAGSNGFTGTRNINISGIKALGSTKVMNTYFTNTLSLTENVAPAVTSARLTATNKVTITFSEAVSQADKLGLDFEVLVGGLSQAVVESVDSNVGTTGVTTVEFTIANVDATKLSKGLSLKALSTLDLVDASGNKVSIPANITVTQ
ncbi:hypothetical protein [Bacillus sp. EAC]|uniref:hypothetical protein n=1 Tax=Bacillus sp. EAC TaxID=1978338 RepID=UPI00211ACABC|nr:hypothetical protein [Bacillus sp. EAC]